jgi:H+/Cl- antiporter ClcA
MTSQRKEFISDKTLLTWIMLCAVSTISCLLITAVIVYVIYDCWIMYQHQLAGGSCGPDVNIAVIIAIPIALGLLIGSLLTHRIIKADKN